MPEQKTLVILSPAFAADEADNWLPSQAAFIRRLNKDHPELRVVILAFHFPLTAPQLYTWHGNTVITFKGGMKGKLHSPLLWIRVWRMLRKICREENVLGLFSFFCSESAFTGHYFARRYGLQHFIWVLGQDAKKTNNQVRRIKPAADELIVISDFLRREFEHSHGIRPAHLVPIGIDPENFGPAPVHKDIDIIGAGSLFPIKQYDLFVAVVRRIADTIPGVQAAIYGEGAERERLQQQIHAAGLDNRLVLAGAHSHSEVLQAMQRSRILLHTSSYEGFGMVCTEALYAGASVISFCKPMDAAIPNWHIVESVEEMAAKAIALLQKPDTYLSSVLPYSMQDTVQQILERYHY